MKKLLVTLGILLAATSLTGLTVRAETALFKKVIVVPGASNQEVVEKVKAWAGQYARVNDVASETGTVVANGEITYPSPPIDRIQYTILFDMKNDIQGNTDTVTFENVMLKSPDRYVSSDANEQIAGKTTPVKSEKDMAAANKRLSYITDNLESYLLTKTEVAGPLMKCPECPVLGTSPEEMKEHMKLHSGDEAVPMK